MTYTSTNTLSPKLKLQSKKLQSGKVQVKFSASSFGKKNCYGYILTDAESTLKEVVSWIQWKLQTMEDVDQYYHQHLYSLNKSKFDGSKFMVFREN